MDPVSELQDQKSLIYAGFSPVMENRSDRVGLNLTSSVGAPVTYRSLFDGSDVFGEVDIEGDKSAEDNNVGAGEIVRVTVTRILNASDYYVTRSGAPTAPGVTLQSGDDNVLNNWWAMLALVLVLGTAAGNILVCLAITWERRLQNVTNYFLMSLAITDLMVAVLVMPLGILTLVRGGIVSLNNKYPTKKEEERRVRSDGLEKESQERKCPDEANIDIIKMKAELFDKLLTELKVIFEHEKQEEKWGEISKRVKLPEEHSAEVQVTKETLEKALEGFEELSTLGDPLKQRILELKEHLAKEKKECVERSEKLTEEIREEEERRRERLVKVHDIAVQSSNDSLITAELRMQLCEILEAELKDRKEKEKERVEELLLENKKQEEKAYHEQLTKLVFHMQSLLQEIVKSKAEASKQAELKLEEQKQLCKDKEEEQRLRSEELLSDNKRQADLERQELEEQHSAYIQQLEEKVIVIKNLARQCGQH